MNKPLDGYSLAWASFAAGAGGEVAPQTSATNATPPTLAVGGVSARRGPERQAPAFVSPAQYARHRKAHGLPGGTREAVHKAIKTGRIALTRTNRVNVRAADLAWQRNTRPWIRQHAQVNDARQLQALDCVQALDAMVAALTACRDQLAHLSARLAPTPIARYDAPAQRRAA